MRAPSAMPVSMNRREEVDEFSCALRWRVLIARVARLLPSSSDAERFFLTADGTTKRTQSALAEDTQEVRHVLAFNPEHVVN